MGYYFGKSTSGKGTTVPLSKALASPKASATGEVPGVATQGGIPDYFANSWLGKRTLPYFSNNVRRRDGTTADGDVRDRTADDTFQNTPVDGIGDWTWPAEMNDLYSMLMGRAGELFNKEGGFGQEEIDAMFGRDFSNIRSQEHGARDMLLQDLASQGMLGTGTETGAIANLAGQTEKNVGDVKTNIFLANEAQKRQDLQTFTSLASQLFGQSMDYQTTEEALNAARRNEANNMLSMLLQYFMASQGSQGG